MATETERKFLIASDAWKDLPCERVDIAQAYLCKDPARTVRIRIAGDEAFLTIKGQAPQDRPLDTPEFEYAIPKEDAQNLLALCLPGAILKTRHKILHDGMTWELDVFHGENAGLVMAEIELDHADQPFTKPDWLGDEVTFDARYKNANLSENPFSRWTRTADGKRPTP